jgi:4,5-DOPA dioxygenase extradiol
MTASPADAVELARHPDHVSAVPTPDHFLPLLYIAGLADADGSTASVLVDGYAYGSLSMTAYTVGEPSTNLGSVSSAAAPLPEPSVAPPDDTNI